MVGLGEDFGGCNRQVVSEGIDCDRSVHASG